MLRSLERRSAFHLVRPTLAVGFGGVPHRRRLNSLRC